MFKSNPVSRREFLAASAGIDHQEEAENLADAIREALEEKDAEKAKELLVDALDAYEGEDEEEQPEEQEEQEEQEQTAQPNGSGIEVRPAVSSTT